MFNKRYLSSVVLGLAVTYGLIFLMSALIATGQSALTENEVGRIVDFVRVEQDESVRTKQREVEKPDKPKTPPPSMPPQQTDPFKANTNINTGFAFNNNPNISADSLASGEGDYLPIVKVAPEYPRRALQRGIEGYVIVEFIVTKAGTVRDPRVVEAKPSGYFERAAIKAASKFKYKPKVINGEPVEVAGVQNKITFQMSEDE